MSTDNPVAVVQRMLEAFEDRDLDRLVETVHPDSLWTYVGANPRPAKRRIRRPPRRPEVL